MKDNLRVALVLALLAAAVLAILLMVQYQTTAPTP